MKKLSFAERLHHVTNPIGRQLLEIMIAKQSNLAVAADVTSKAKLLELADMLGPKICVLKTHIDIVEDFDTDLIDQLTTLATQHRFLIFEDRKFADIGNTVKLQYGKGVHHIAEWSHFVNAHVLPGPGIIEGLSDVGLSKGKGCILISSMSSAGSLYTPEYERVALSMAEKYKDFVFGFISQFALNDDPRWLYLTPGVKLAATQDNLQQQYRTPKIAIQEQGCDIVIVGRGVIEADNPVEIAEQYRVCAWQLYQECVSFA